MSAIGQRFKWFFRPGDTIPAHWLTSMARWVGGMYSPDGSVEVTHNAQGIALQVRRETAATADVSATTPGLRRMYGIYDWRYSSNLKKFQVKRVTFSAYDPQYSATWVDAAATFGTCATP
jgi:hypothetical protein